ncbi:ABC transporter ATP-binding protein [Pseudonocardia pini]|uniref:ABC transporter ATP-binding protein n=1 Tax=Pseudonocardia pini TaxID=2758030 RepID=UPI0015F0B352|nr:ATP-binding cassette domain-containing protein [Pseudonocardia pini]
MGGLLELSGLGKRYGAVGDTWALHDVSLSVAAGTVHCVLGENGAGKSTLCNLVNGGVRATTGRMALRGETYSPGSPADALGRGVAMVHQHFSLVSTMTVQENLQLVRRRGLRERLDRIADEFGLVVDTGRRVADLPVGARQKVEIVKALLPDPDLVLLDEPTGVLDGAEIDALIGTCQAVAASGRAVVLVTHKLGEVARVADAATVLRNGSVAGGGRLSEVPVPRLLSLMLGKDPADLDADTAGAVGLEPTEIGGNARSAPSEGAGTALSARNVHPASSEGAGTALSARNVHPASSEGAGTALSARNVLSVRGLTVRGPDGTSALAAADLDLRAGEITGIAGVEGNGQSELVRVLSGALRPTEGTVLLADTDITTATPAVRTRHGLGVVPEDRHHEGIVGALSVAENLFLADLDRFRRRGLLQRKALDAAAAAVIAEYRIRTDGPRAEMRSLSGGNQQKVVLARELAIDGLRVLVAAQPTRGLDVGAVAAVLARLREAADRGVAVLVVSSEVPELLALCDRILVGYRGRLLGPVDAREPTAAAEIGALMTGTAA